MARTQREIQDFLERLNRFPWGRAEEITPEAEALVEKHLERMRAVLSHLQKEKGLNLTDAEMHASTPGNELPEQQMLVQALFRRADLIGLGGREHVIFNLTADCFWQDDPDLRGLENPWTPLVELYEMGYTTSGGEDQREDELVLKLWCKAGCRSYRVV